MLIYPQYNQTSWQGQDPFQQFSKLKEKIKASSFPTKYKVQAGGTWPGNRILRFKKTIWK